MLRFYELPFLKNHTKHIQQNINHLICKIYDIDELLEEMELRDLFDDIVYDDDDYYNEYDEEEKGVSLGSNGMRIGAKAGFKKKGKLSITTLAKIRLYSNMNDENKPLWDGRKTGLNANTKPTLAAYKAAYKHVKNLRWGCKFSANEQGQDPDWKGKDPKDSHGINGDMMTAVKLYTDDSKVATMIRRLFYNYKQYSEAPLMPAPMLHRFREYAGKLYEATHGSKFGDVLKMLYAEQQKGAFLPDAWPARDKRRSRQTYLQKDRLITWVGMKNVDLNAVGDEQVEQWNPDGQFVWWGPTSTTLEFGTAVNFGGAEGDNGVVFEIAIPIKNIKINFGNRDSGAIAVLMFSGCAEKEVLLWNIPVIWMRPVMINGRWVVPNYEPFYSKLKKVRVRGGPMMPYKMLTDP